MTGEEPTDEASAKEQRAAGEVLRELETLGQQLVTTVRSLWESEESRNLRQEIGQGFVQLGREIDAAMISAQQSEAAKQFSEQIKDTVDKARESDMADKLEQGLVSGLRELNEQISRFVDSLESRPSTAEEPGDRTEE